MALQDMTLKLHDIWMQIIWHRGVNTCLTRIKFDSSIGDKKNNNIPVQVINRSPNQQK